MDTPRHTPATVDSDTLLAEALAQVDAAPDWALPNAGTLPPEERGVPHKRLDIQALG